MRPMVGIASWFVLLVSFVLLSVGVATAADNLEKLEKASPIIKDFASHICVIVKQEGTSRDVKLSGKAKGELNWLLKRLVNLGVEGAAQFQDLEYQGLLQGQLAEQLNKSRDCQERVSGVLIARLFPEAQELPINPPSDPSERPLPPKTEQWVAPLPGDRLMGSWETKILSNNIPYIIVYTFYPDGSFLSSSATGDQKSRGRFQHRRGHVLIELDNGTSEYAELHMMENQFRYRIVDHTNQAAIGHETIFRRLRR